MPIHYETVTRATDLLRAAGMRITSLPTVRIDRAGYEDTARKLTDRHERQDGGSVIITGQHGDFGNVTLRREAGVFTIECDDTSFVRKWGERLPT